MSIQSSFYSTDGKTKTYPSTKHIATKQHMAVWLREVSGSLDIQLNVNEYELITNAAVLTSAPDPKIYDRIEVRVADNAGELTDSPSDISIVAAIAAEIVTVAGIESEVVAVANNEAMVNTVGTDLAKGIGTNQPTDSAILNALTNANTASTKAAEALASADSSELDKWEAEAEKMTADSYATEPEDVFVKIYTSAGDGINFPYTNSTEYSSLHWATKSGGGYIRTSGVVYVDTIGSLSLVDTTDITTAIVQEEGRGGTFNYDAPQAGVNDGGTIFDGWVREYSGAVNVKWFGAVGNGTDDDILKLQDAVDFVISHTSNRGKRPLALYFPTGEYVVSRGLVLDMPNGINLGESGALKIYGDGKASTSINVSPASAHYGMELLNGKFELSDMSFIGYEGSGEARGIKLGSIGSDMATSKVVTQSKFTNLEFLYLEKGIDIHFLFDTEFNNIGVISTANNGTAVHCRTNPIDNVNNLLWTRCHFERTYGDAESTLFRVDKSTAPSQFHHAWTFVGCHFETTAWNVKALELTGLTSTTFTGCVFNMHNGNAVVAESTRLPIVDLNDCVGLAFYSCVIQITSGATAGTFNKIIQIRGNSFDTVFDSCKFFDASTTVVNLDGFVDLSLSIDTDGSSMSLRRISANGNNNALLNSPYFHGGSNRRFRDSVNNSTSVKELSFDSDTVEDGEFNPSSIFSVSSLGDMSSGGKKIASTGAYIDIYSSVENSSLGTGIYMIMFDAPAQGMAIVFRRESLLTSMFLGSDVEINTNSPTSGKFGLEAVGSNILRVHSNYGSDRYFSIFKLGFN